MMTPPRKALHRLRDLYLRTFDLDALIRTTVAEARAEGASWSQIGEQLGITKQAAQQRFGR